MKGRASKKLDELLDLCSNLKHELQSVRKQMRKQQQQLKKQGQQNRHSSNLIKQLHQSLMKDQGSLVSKAGSSVQRRLELSFVCALPSRLFTANKIYAVDASTGTNVPVRVVLLDEGRELVKDGPLSSLKIEILVAYGDVKAEESEEWTGKEVEMRRVRAREEKGTLLVGGCIGIMENGVCSFNDLKFVDNSSWVPSKTFKLVAKVVETAQVPEMAEEIRPAVSRAFQVMDQRGKQYEKQSVPSWDGDVWRLKKIRRNGPYHRKLEDHGIRTVMDFRRRYTIDQSSLRKILGTKDGVWATIVQHANECCPNSELFRYDSEEGVELLFDCFYNLIGVSFDHQIEQSLENLSELEKNLVEQLRQRAFEDHSKLIQINSFSGWPSAKTSQWMASDPPPHQGDTTLNELSFGCESFPQSPLWFSAEDMHRLEESTAQRIAEIEGFSTVESGCILWDSFKKSDQNHP